jgi:hypothetical protein
MACTRALRIRRNANAATDPHRIGADWIAGSDQEPPAASRLESRFERVESRQCAIGCSKKSEPNP